MIGILLKRPRDSLLSRSPKQEGSYAPGTNPSTWLPSLVGILIHRPHDSPRWLPSLVGIPLACPHDSLLNRVWARPPAEGPGPGTRRGAQAEKFVESVMGVKSAGLLLVFFRAAPALGSYVDGFESARLGHASPQHICGPGQKLSASAVGTSVALPQTSRAEAGRGSRAHPASSSPFFRWGARCVATARTPNSWWLRGTVSAGRAVCRVASQAVGRSGGGAAGRVVGRPIEFRDLSGAPTADLVLAP